VYVNPPSVSVVGPVLYMLQGLAGVDKNPGVEGPVGSNDTCNDHGVPTVRPGKNPGLTDVRMPESSQVIVAAPTGVATESVSSSAQIRIRFMDGSLQR
jgi:hypothetical protein